MLAETVDELLTIFRNEVDDAIGTSGEDSDRLWKDAELLTYLTEACDKTAKETLGLTERISLSVVADQSYVTLPQRVLNIRSAKLLTAKAILEERNLNELDSLDLFDNTGTPHYFSADYRAGALELTPVPAANDTLEVQCSVTIRDALTTGDDVPFTDSEDQRLVLLYMKALAYRKQDAETEDLTRAGMFEQEFFAKARVRQARIRSYRRRPGTVKMSGW